MAAKKKMGKGKMTPKMAEAMPKGKMMPMAKKTMKKKMKG